MTKDWHRLLPLGTLALALWPTFALAHTGGIVNQSFSGGFLHPIGGLDHLLAMTAVGLWSGQFGDRTIWLAPLGFMSFMAVGGALGMAATGFPFVEQGIIASVLIFGILVMLATRPPVWVGLITIGIFALFHGYAHGSEMAPGTSEWFYAAGFLLATGLLHLTGIAIATLLERFHLHRVVQAAGAGILIGGLVLMAA